MGVRFDFLVFVEELVSFVEVRWARKKERKSLIEWIRKDGKKDGFGRLTIGRLLCLR